MRRSWDAAPFTHCGSNCCVVCPFLNKTKTTCCPPWGIHPEGGPAEQAAYFSSTYYSPAKGEQPSGSDRTKSVEGLSVSAIQLFHGLLLPYFASCLFASMGLSRPIWGGVSRICRRTRPGPRSSGCCMPSNIWGGCPRRIRPNSLRRPPYWGLWVCLRFWLGALLGGGSNQYIHFTY